jgi:hypothetical protein
MAHVAILAIAITLAKLERRLTDSCSDEQSRVRGKHHMARAQCALPNVEGVEEVKLCL